jgi:hypothetical protein
MQPVAALVDIYCTCFNVSQLLVYAARASRETAAAAHAQSHSCCTNLAPTLLPLPLLLLLLLLLQCYKLIYGYMGFAMLNIFFFFTGALVLQLLRLIGLHMDLFSLAFLLFNFSVRIHVNTMNFLLQVFTGDRAAHGPVLAGVLTFQFLGYNSC